MFSTCRWLRNSNRPVSRLDINYKTWEFWFFHAMLWFIHCYKIMPLSIFLFRRIRKFNTWMTSFVHFQDWWNSWLIVRIVPQLVGGQEATKVHDSNWSNPTDIKMITAKKTKRAKLPQSFMTNRPSLRNTRVLNNLNKLHVLCKWTWYWVVTKI